MPEQPQFRLTIAQQPLAWEDPVSNLIHFSQTLQGLAGQTDLVILPEMFTTGFTTESKKLAEPMNGVTMRWMEKTAAQLKAAITGSFICQDNGHYYNRLIWMLPNGEFFSYDKRHLFAYAGEHEGFTQGNTQLVVDYLGLRICPLICYDLRFPVWARYTEELDYDLLIYTANWPEKRRKHWQQLLIARAIENQCYVVGVNRVGEDGKGFTYQGDSAVIDPMGESLYQASGQPVLHTVQIDIQRVDQTRDQFPFLDDRDDFQLSL